MNEEIEVKSFVFSSLNEEKKETKYYFFCGSWQPSSYLGRNKPWHFSLLLTTFSLEIRIGVNYWKTWFDKAWFGKENLVMREPLGKLTKDLSALNITQSVRFFPLSHQNAWYKPFQPYVRKNESFPWDSTKIEYLSVSNLIRVYLGRWRSKALNVWSSIIVSHWEGRTAAGLSFIGNFEFRRLVS